MMKIPKMVTIDKLAQMIARGFEDLEKRLTAKFEEQIGFLENKIDGINNRIDDLALNRATRDEVYSLNKRVTRIENKLGFKT